MIIHLFLIISLISLPCQSYSPPDSIAIDCGSSSPLSQSHLNRTWHGDGDTQPTSISNFTLTQTHNSLTLQSQNQPTNKIPSFTARLSPSPFSYLFSLSSLNPIFLRLHFYPDTYGSFDHAKAFFEVKANQWTLLSNFSPSLSAYYVKGETLVKEYSLNPQSKILNLTFAPLDSIARVIRLYKWYGIEIVSVPSGLYYGSGGTLGFKLIGNELKRYHLSNDIAMELAYRLNVGGRFISAIEDTGMFREWTADDEFYNVIGALPEGLDINLKWTSNVPNYTAPDMVYKTARTMGNNATHNYRYNLTWNLPVSTDFTYWVRLHFCEFQKEIMAQGDREFIIYINNQIAEIQADVIAWNGGNSIPVYRNYVVNIWGKNKTQNLIIALHPGPKQYTKYSDAILNGVEVFKLSISNGSLASPNPDPLSATPSQKINVPPKKENSSTGLIAGILAGVITFLILGLISGIFILRRGRSMDFILSS